MSTNGIKIKDLFERNIKRELNGVIKVDQEDEKNVYTELDEYVITVETQKNLDKFFSVYIRSLEEPTDKVGVWISGFFGSGKSHFIKMLSYLLENRKVRDKYALDFFKEKIHDQMLLSNIEKVVNAGTKDVILFNIDTKANKATMGDQKNELIVNILMRIFNEKRGFLGDVLWVAELEEDLEKKGLYLKFKEEFKKISGKTWEEKRDAYSFEQDDIVKALVNCGYQSKESIVRLFESDGRNYLLNVDKFAHKILEYCKSKGKDHRIIFLVDEMGQFIGEKSDLMLDLQSIVEELGIILKAKAWVIVTSQADIDTITKEQVKGYDFSKIQGRFDTRLPLSSANVDEVIKKRLLAKKDKYKESLSSFYTEKKTVIRNLISFSQSAEMKTYSNEEDFINVYPFIPYQFKLLQKVFEKIRKTGFTGKHLAKGERSMLSAFKESTERYCEETIGILIPFSSFYDTIESFLDPIIKRTIDQAKDNSFLKKEDIELIKILFMIRHVKEIKPTLDNLTILSIDDVDKDKIKLRENISDSLKRLEEQTLVHHSQDSYFFLTNDEQEINKEIKNMDIDRHQIQDEVYQVIFNDICPPSYKIYKFNKSVDNHTKPIAAADMTIRFLTPYADEYSWGARQKSLDGQSLGLIDSKDTLLFVFPEDSEFLEQIQTYLKINKYLLQNTSYKNNPDIQNILVAKSQERDSLRDSFIQSISAGISDAKVFVCDKEVSLEKTNPKERIKEGLEVLVKNVYNKSHYVTKEYETIDDIFHILRSDDLEKFGVKNETNKLARKEIFDYIKLNQVQNTRVLLSTIKEIFMRKPYGWNEITISGLVAFLFVTEDIKLRYQKTYLMSSSPEDVAKYLTKSIEADKLVIEIREKTAIDQINKVKSILKEIFDKTDIPDKETELFTYTHDTLQQELTAVASIQSKYAEENRFPGKKPIEEYCSLLTKFLEVTDPLEFFNVLLSEKEQLVYIYNKVEPVINFFDSQQVVIFRRVIQRIDLFKRNVQFISDEAKANIKRIEEIITLDEPYSQIKELSPLERKIEDSLTESLAHEKEKVMEKIKTVTEEIKHELNIHSELTNDFKLSILDPFTSIKKMTDDANECALVVVQLSKIDELRSEAYKTIEKKTRVIKETGETSKQTHFIDTTELFRYTKVIETEQDLEEYIQHMRSKLKEILKKKKIKVL